MQKSVNLSLITFASSAPLRLCVIFLLVNAYGLFAQQGLPFDDWAEARGDTAIAERYYLWIEDAIAAGQWSQALAALERAGDFADASSDISYLMARVLAHEDKSRGSILWALNKAISTAKWYRYTEADARFMQVGELIAMRRYSAALDSLAVRRADVGDDADSSMLRLEALKGLALSGPIPSVPVEFRRRLLETMDRYPRDPRPLRILFDYAGNRAPSGDDFALMSLALRRLPFLLPADAELAWMAAPFIDDVAEARRLVGAYRSGSLLANARGFRPAPASILPALNLGLLDDLDAVAELLSGDVLDKDIILGVGELLRSDEGRDALVRGLLDFSGTITEDEDKDGIPESRAVYREGVMLEYRYDADQNGLDEISIIFDSGAPRQAEIAALAEAAPSNHYPLTTTRCLIHWERYPSVERIVLGTDTFLFAPGGFHYAPLGFDELCATESHSGLLFPRRDPLSAGITRRMLSAFAVSVQRPANLSPGGEFDGGVEHLYLEGGIPRRSEVIIDGAVVSVTEFENGRPIIQRIDLDRDGRLETIRQYRPSDGVLQSSQSDWDNTGAYGYSETYREDGSIVYKWEGLEE